MSSAASGTLQQQAFVTGPRVTKQMPGSDRLADRLGHDRRAALLAADRELDVAADQRVEHRQVALAGKYRRGGRLDDRLVDEGLGGYPAQFVGVLRTASFR